ncbi:poly(R)-hydroxyalkanoic acid synthase subunit PhaE [Neptuniibacter sp. QD37_6]|uniref:poly(R)-hydroxyalkanoic acid synthase subunit PhaE n=1 Tax=Neptuniibacter sp. QD37_6 TaxID=3398210 RepID=UPI0039F48C2F
MENNGLSMEALLDAQKEYWKKITSGAEMPQPQEWAELFTKSQETAKQEAPEQFAQMLDILGAQSKNFIQYGEDLLNQYRNGGEQHLNQAVQEFQKYMQKQTADALMQQWQLPEQFASLFKTHSFRDDLLFENPFSSGMKSLLETPIIGTHRETQQQTREATKLTIEYQEALQEYVEHYSSINQNASTQMLNKLTEAVDEVSTLQQLHDIWVEAYESAYSDTVFTDAYQRSHGRISNALMNMRKFAQDVRDVHFQSVGLATRKGLDTALQRQHQMRKEMRNNRREMLAMQQEIAALKEQAAADLISELKKEISALKKEVTSLKKQAKGTK